ncbi:MAG: aminotransferase class I/II-fold pyridoxal phosphate-dependent enzyme, partial [Dehalococcoidia bacterium]|nr:aminotransferase class I/II-fold pyridoxal phosphate-dependent enzyme [Dehalococcoidia bacterium]
VLASLADMDYLRSNVAKIVAERERLFSELKELKWLSPYPSRANFVLCSVHCCADSLHYHSEGAKQAKKLAQGKLSGGSPAREIWQRLQKRGIFIRYFDSPQLRDYLRISVGKPEDTEALIGALREIESGGI